MPAKTPLERACESAGGATKLAGLIGVSVQTLSNWKDRGVPIERCVAIEQATDAAVTRRDLRPDDWQAIWPELAAPTPATPRSPTNHPSQRASDKPAANAGTSRKTTKAG